MRTPRTAPQWDPAPGRVDADAVVSYNVAAIRHQRGWTQEEVAERLGVFSGRRLPKSSMSMERGFERGRTRRFNAQELYLLSVVFDVPVAYFFLPPPGAEATELADTGRPVVDLYASALGTEEQLAVFDGRLGEMRVDNPNAAEAVLGAVFAAGPSWAAEFQAWRRTRLEDVSRHYGPRLDEIAGVLREFAQALTALSPRAYLEGTSLARQDAGGVLHRTRDRWTPHRGGPTWHS
jgi:transcriptional regulator with XRE-family HTH domain